MSLKTAVIGACRAASLALARRRAHDIARPEGHDLARSPLIDDGTFVGREDLILRILSTIHNNSIVLLGERGIGKTSVLLHIETRLRNIADPSYDFVPVYVDLQGVPQCRLFETLGMAILREVGTVLRDGSPTNPRVSDIDYGHRELAADLRRVFVALKARSSRRVRLVLLVDGIDQLNRYDPRTTQRLRGLYMMSLAENLVMVAAGVEINKQWEKEGSPWYNFFEEIELTALGREDARQMIALLLVPELNVEPGATERLLKLTECKPLRIETLCRALIDHHHEQNCGAVTVADVDAVSGPEGTAPTTDGDRSR